MTARVRLDGGGALRGRHNTLMLSCAAAAVAAVSAGQEARAQAFQGRESVVNGVADRFATGETSETIMVGSSTATINWTPYDVEGSGTIDFLPDGYSATFTNNPELTSDFTVLNRIIPFDPSRPIALNGRVISQLQDFSQNVVTGGNVWFYSPGGIVVGSTAVFDVGGLLLTANDPVQFGSTANGFSGQFVSDPASTAMVQVQQGAQINATAGNSYVALIAPRVEQNGSVRVDGSAAFVAAQRVTMTLNQGLFDIQVDLGTDDPNGIVHSGSTTGPASSGAGDNHRIYMVAVPKNQALTALLSGTVGFDPAISASVENGMIVLSAGYSVNSEENGAPAEGDSLFGTISDNGAQPVSAAPADFHIEGGRYTSDLIGRASNNLYASSLTQSTTFEGDVTLIGAANAHINARNGNTITVGGDAVVSNGFSDAFHGRATTGGATLIQAEAGSTLTIAGNATVDAGVRGDRNQGATGGSAILNASGTVAIGGSVDVNADGFGGATGAGETGGTGRGGDAVIFAGGGGSLTVGGDVSVRAGALSGIDQSGGIASDSFGGRASIIADGGTIAVSGSATADAFAFGGSSFNGGTAGSASGGTVDVAARNGGGIAVDGALVVDAIARGGTASGALTTNGGGGFGGGAFVTADNGTISVASLDGDVSGTGSAGTGDGIGGNGSGGIVRAATGANGSLTITGSTSLTANGVGGSGQTGGLGQGGNAGIDSYSGSISLGATTILNARGEGGDASLGFGGLGGDGTGGTVYIEALQDEVAGGTVTGGNATLDVSANGGDGGDGNGQIAAGAGGTGQGGAYNGELGSGGAFVLAQANRGQLTMANVILHSFGTGGRGGTGAAGQVGGAGGIGSGGTTQIGLFGSDGSALAATADYGNAILDSSGFGGQGGDGGAGVGIGGDASGGASFVIAATSIANASIISDAFAGAGGSGGNAFGGFADLELPATTATEITGTLLLSASAIGGFGSSANGGSGSGGQAQVLGNGGALTVAGATNVVAHGAGGDGAGGDGGNGSGGSVSLSGNSGSSFGFGAATLLAAAGDGGDGVVNGGTGSGGGVTADFDNASLTVSGGGFRMLANATGGGGSQGGDGLGGSSELDIFSGGAAVDMPGEVILEASGEGGAGTDSSQSTGGAGGAGSGGTAEVFVTSAPNSGASVALDLGTTSIIANGTGGAGGSGVTGGTGGSGDGGDVSFFVGSGAADVAELSLATTGRGGVGGDGSSGIGGDGGAASGGFTSTEAAGRLTASIVSASARAIGGDAGQGSTAGVGGLADGGNIEIYTDLGGQLDAGAAELVADAIGGAGATGGMATGGSAELFNNGATTADALTVVATATGGNGSDLGGDAVGGAAVIDANGGSVDVAGALNLTADANGGTGVAVGAGTAGIAGVLVTGAPLSTGSLSMSADGSTGGGTNLLYVDASVDPAHAGALTAGTTSLSSDGGVTGGSTTIYAVAGNTVTLGDTIISAAGPDGSGGVAIFAGLAGEVGSALTGGGFSAGDLQVTTDGTIELLADGGSAFETASLTAGAGAAIFADGATAAGAIDLSANGGVTASNLSAGTTLMIAGPGIQATNLQAGTDITLSGDSLILSGLSAAGSLTATAASSLEATDLLAGDGITLWSGGDLIASNLEAGSAIDLTAGLTAYILGFISAPLISVTSADLEIAGAGLLGEEGVTDELVLVAQSAGNPVIIGGSEPAAAASLAASDLQYRLTALEASQIEARSVIVRAEGIGGAGDPDVLIHDLTIEGSLAGGTANVELFTGGSVIVDGLIDYFDAGAGDRLAITAGQTIQVITSGGRIAMTDADGMPGGILELSAADIWVADAALIDQLSQDPNFAGRDQALATSGGEPVPEGYLIAGTMTIGTSRTLFVQNSGGADDFAGITVGEGGLTIRSTGNSPSTVVAYGRGVAADGSQTTGDAFFALIGFEGAQGSFAGKFNGCTIGENCDASPQPLPLPPPQSASGPESILGPIQSMWNSSSAQEDDREYRAGSENGGGSDSDSGGGIGISIADYASDPGLAGDLLNEPVASGGDTLQWIDDDEDDDDDKKDK